MEILVEQKLQIQQAEDGISTIWNQIVELQMGMNHPSPISSNSGNSVSYDNAMIPGLNAQAPSSKIEQVHWKMIINFKVS